MKSRILTQLTRTTVFQRLLNQPTLIASLALILFAASAGAEPWVYVVTSNNQFGAVDLATGAFHPVGAPTPEGQANLVWGPDGSLLSLTYSGNLERIDPATGETTVIGATGLGSNAFDLAEVRGKLYATDFSNKIYSVDSKTGAAQLLRATGIPPDPTIPFSTNPDGTVNLCDETLYGVGGKLYATFDSFKVDPVTLKINSVVDPNLYEIDPSTGAATLVAPTRLNLGASVEVNGKFYAFHIVITAWTNSGPQGQSQLVTLDRENGKTRFVRDIDAAAGAVFGAAPVRKATITFDAPGAGTGSGQGTFPFAINPAEAITGYYTDASNVNHGFLRTRDGEFTTFDASPGAVNGTYPFAINPAGAITGLYCDAITCHGFLRARDDDITTFDISGAAQGTFGYNINPAGAIAGSYVDASGESHGFLRAPDGTITTFDAPGAGTGSNQGTFTAFTDGLNPAGALAGYYVDASGGNHSFLRAPDGTVTTFDVPGAVTGTGPFQGTKVAGINPSGTISGNYFDANTASHGYLRAPDGAITKYDVSGAGTGPSQGTVGAAINPTGELVSYFVDDSNVFHGYLRTKHGTVTKFDVPDAGTGPGQGTFPFDNNPAGAVTGYYVDASSVAHGFLRTSCHRNDAVGRGRDE